MIYPINGTLLGNNYLNRRSFKGVDPALLSHNSSSKHLVDNAALSINAFKDTKLPSGIEKIIEKTSEIKIIDANNIVNTTTGKAIHILPDGTPITYDIDNDAQSALQISENTEGIELPSSLKQESGISILDERNIIDNNINTLLHDTGNGVVIPVELSPLQGTDIIDSTDGLNVAVADSTSFGDFLDMLS